MLKWSIVLPFLSCIAITVFAQDHSLTKGMKISKSIGIKSSTYKITAAHNLTTPVLVIEGNNIILDFKNATLQGSSPSQFPDEFYGVAILIQNSKKVTIKNLKVKGYKVALIARNVDDLTLDNCDFSYNYRQHLNSTQEKEDLADWMSYHHNENDEWLRYGAAMYLRGCANTTIKNCRVTGGQNALMMMECDNGLIYNNDFSFNSGIGIGLYHSSHNKILYNKVIFNVRGYSDGVYNRGQDSAGMLVYEQSNENVFYKNNVTHSGDGFFLWAGQTTMDSGTGGCNDNVIKSNDFSYAATNGIEVTFSRNSILDNRIFECDNGIWAGYSYGSIISNNKFRNNNVGIAIEHGQQNRIDYNIFYRDKLAIHLWGRATQPVDWGYAKNRNTNSRGYTITSNNFNNNTLVFNISRTDSLTVLNNIYTDYRQLFKIDSTVTKLDTVFNDQLSEQRTEDSELVLPAIDRPENPFKNVTQLAGKKNIFITAWGPYDFRSPVIWNVNPTDTTDTMLFEIKGAGGKWKVKSARGVESLSATSGEFPATITAKKIKGERTDIDIELEYQGAALITPFGEKIVKGKPYLFSFKKFFQPIDWTINWFNMDTAVFNPVNQHDLFAPNVRMQPIKSEKAVRLDFALWNGLKTTDSTFNQFITTAEGKANFEKGSYELSVTWDDAVRLYVDGKMVIDEWQPSKYLFDESPNKKVKISLGGEHHFRVEHLNLGGFAVLALKIAKLQ